MFSRDEMQRAIEDALKTMEGVALELYRRGREPLLEELEEARARNADMRAMLEQVTRERDEARASCTDCAMWAERSARWHDDMQRAERERDEARAEVEKLSESAKAAWEAECVMREQRDRYHAELKQERQEVERLRTALLEVQTSESAPAWFADGFHDGWKAGAEAMRKRCEELVKHNSHEDGIGMGSQRIESAIRALPIPEEP